MQAKERLDQELITLANIEGMARRGAPFNDILRTALVHKRFIIGRLADEVPSSRRKEAQAAAARLDQILRSAPVVQ